MADAAAPVITGNQYSEAQHFSLVKSAVEQETAQLTSEKSELQAQVETLESEKAALATELSEAKSRMDVLESDKATAEAAAETAKKEFVDYKAEAERAAQVQTLKGERVQRVKAANENLADGYFTDERIQRWAEMSDESFDSLVSEMTEFAKAAKAEGDTTSTAEQARETAAFTGGETPAETENGVSTLASFLSHRQSA